MATKKRKAIQSRPFHFRREASLNAQATINVLFEKELVPVKRLKLDTEPGSVLIQTKNKAGKRHSSVIDGDKLPQKGKDAKSKAKESRSQLLQVVTLRSKDRKKRQTGDGSRRKGRINLHSTGSDTVGSDSDSDVTDSELISARKKYCARRVNSPVKKGSKVQKNSKNSSKARNPPSKGVSANQKESHKNFTDGDDSRRSDSEIEDGSVSPSKLGKKKIISKGDWESWRHSRRLASLNAQAILAASCESEPRSPKKEQSPKRKKKIEDNQKDLSSAAEEKQGRRRSENSKNSLDKGIVKEKIKEIVKDVKLEPVVKLEPLSKSPSGDFPVCAHSQVGLSSGDGSIHWTNKAMVQQTTDDRGCSPVKNTAFHRVNRTAVIQPQPIGGSTHNSHHLLGGYFGHPGSASQGSPSHAQCLPSGCGYPGVPIIPSTTQCQSFTLGGLGSISTLMMYSPRQMGSAFRVPPHYAAHAPPPLYPNACYYQPAGPLIQAVPDSCVLSHGIPVPIPHIPPNVKSMASPQPTLMTGSSNQQVGNNPTEVPREGNTWALPENKRKEKTETKSKGKKEKPKEKEKEKVKGNLKKDEKSDLNFKNNDKTARPAKKKDVKIEEKKDKKKEEKKDGKKSENKDGKKNDKDGKRVEKKRKSKDENDNLEKNKKQERKPSYSGWKFEGPPEEKCVISIDDNPPVRRMCYPAIKHDDGDIIRVRDCVLLKSGPRKTDLPYVAKIAAFWEMPEDKEMMMSVLWYYRPEHTETCSLPKTVPNEIFASKHRDENSVACIDDKCYVLTFAEYCR
ncbi:uncharacterized protein LOC106177050 [Lingula anatina]|uniref:Uncharacterized protein LOC106177050 n=1 Tax=Lingula anatina TaxID=7574 RepID=A0A1S3JYJ9_LINAN|nr:uncharacterized protein LOC106177050 [Lingula anatina]|eukprot:XP_013415149.1 uncharacterized protein LOC106177050 [Lingula anatina]